MLKSMQSLRLIPLVSNHSFCPRRNNYPLQQVRCLINWFGVSGQEKMKQTSQIAIDKTGTKSPSNAHSRNALDKPLGPSSPVGVGAQYAAIFGEKELDRKEIDERAAFKHQWEGFNKAVYAPSPPTHPIRPAEVTHNKTMIHYSKKNLWHITSMVCFVDNLISFDQFNLRAYEIRGLSIDEAIRQLAFRRDKGSHIVKEILQEAQRMAVDEHHVEFATNLWISDAFVHPGESIPRILRMYGKRITNSPYVYSDVFVRLREGPPPRRITPRGSDVPANRFATSSERSSNNELLARHLESLRSRRIFYDL